MKDLLTLRESASPGIWEIVDSSEADRKSAAAASHVSQPISKNPVILALRRFDDLQPESKGHATDRLRIANEIMRQLGWSNGPAPTSSDGAAVWALREQSSREQVKRTRAELEAYLDQGGGDEALAIRLLRDQSCRPHESRSRNPILAVLADHCS